MKYKILKIFIPLCICFVLFITVGDNGNLTIEEYTASYVYNNNELVTVTTNEEEQDYIDDTISDYSNIDVTNSNTFIEFDTSDSAVEELSNISPVDLAPGYEVKIDDQYTFYTEDKDNVESAIELILQIYLPESAYQDYLLTGEIPTFKLDDKTYTSFSMTSDISYNKGYYDEDLMLNTVDDITYYLLHGTNPPVYETITDDNDIDSIIQENEINETVFELNNPNVTSDTLFYDGQQVIVNDLDMVINFEGKYETDEERVIEYQTFEKPSSDLTIGESQTTIQGEDGLELLSFENIEVNGQVIEQNLISNNIEVAPVNEIITYGTKEIPSVGTGEFIWPEDCRTITNGYLGYSGHYAIDFQCGYGSSIYAADNGVVVTNEYMDGGYGNYVVIDHNNGYRTLYAHMKEPSELEVGDVVYKGQVIGYEGNTGWVITSQTGATAGHHLHYEIQIVDDDGNVISKPNPLDYYDDY